MKMFAGRETNLRDVRSVIVRQGLGRLDWNYIEVNLSDLADLKDDRTLLIRLRSVRESCES
jgi:hypothetical protein